MHWSTAYVGLPWADRGRDRSGCDCWGLARLVYEAELGIALPSYAGEYPSAEEQIEIDGLIRGAVAVGPWIEVEAPEPFDLVLFGLGRFDSHIGVMVDRARMLHMMGRDAAKIERVDAPQWLRRRRGIWRHRERFEILSM
jgi:cell wall-associated NlpC family hydrolase